MSSHKSISSQTSSRPPWLPTWPEKHLGIKLGKPQAGAGFVSSYGWSQAVINYFHTSWLVGHPRPFLMEHLCHLIWYIIRRSLPSWFQRGVPPPGCVPIVQSTACPCARGHSKQFVKYLGATCPTLPVPRAFVPTNPL